MKKTLFLFFSLFLFKTISAQVNTFEKVANEINIPTQPYSVIKLGADSLFEHWHAQNPNDTGLAPGEKNFIRWSALAQSRGHIAGDNTTSVTSIQANMNNQIGSVSYCSSGPANHEWQLIGPNPESGDKMVYGIANTIAVHPSNSNIIYAGTQEGGLFKTTDGGSNWNNITDQLNLSGLGVVSIAIDPNNSNTLLIGTYSESFGYTGWLSYSSQGYGILKSTDGGLSWSTTSLIASKQEGHISVIRFDPQNSNTVFAAGSTGIYKSTDNGSTWSEVFTTSTDPSLKNTHFIDIEISGNSNMICVSTLKSGGHNITEKAARVFCSSNGGTSFTDCTPTKAFQYTMNGSTPLFSRAAHSIALDVSPDDPNNIYAFFASDAISNSDITNTSATLVKTSNGGSSWSEVFDQTSSVAQNVVWMENGHWGRWRHQFELSDDNADKVYIGGDVLLMYEHGVSSTWTPISVYWPSQQGHADIRWIHNYGNSNGEDELFIANDGGLAYTSNSGSTWTNLNGNGFSVSQIHGFASWPTNEHYVMGAMHNLQHSIGNGVKYLGRFSPGGDGAYAISEPGSDDHFYMNSNAGLYRCRRYSNGDISPVKFIQAHTELTAKFDAVEDNGAKLYYSSNGDIKVFNPATNSSNTVFNSTTTEEFSVIKVAPSNPDVIYAAKFEACWGCTNNNGSVSNKLWKRTGIGNWVDISANITKNGSNYQYLAATYITDIAIDPYDDDRLWVGVAYYSPDLDQNRVFYSSDGGTTWQDQSVGLPPYPVNCLAYQEGSDDIIYAGTDGGVYYFDKSADNENGAWQCFNNNLPPAIITKIDVQPCRSMVIASTYGRALWEVPMIQNSKVQETVSSTTSWGTAARHFTSNLVVENGATLTITGTVEFSTNSSLIVMPGAKVILDGGHLTADGACGGSNYSWRGVRVLGDVNQNQSPTTHGVFVIKNNGTISHARTAITNAGWTGYDFDWGTQGGIIWANNAIFLNNRRDLQFIRFHNNHNGGVEWNYKARFTNCLFKRDGQYAMESPLNAITLWDVNGISFKGCTLENNISDYPYSGNGIYALTAQFKAEDLTTSSGTIRNEFSGYDYAIHSSNVFSINRYTTIKNCDFDNNRHGVYLSALSNTEFTNNSFTVPDLLVPSGQAGLYGSYFDACSGFEFNLNEYSGQGSTYPKAGAIWRNCGERPSLVYKNSFDNLSCAVEAIGNNKGPGLQGGLVFKCNNFGEDNVNALDIGVWKENNSLLPQGIAASQGEWNGSLSQSDELANNLFSNNSQDIYNENGSYMFSYHYGSGNSRFDPYQSFNINEQSHSVSVTYNNDCPDPNSNHTNITLRQSLNNNEASLSNKRAQYALLLNGGNTAELEAEILLANQQELQSLYLELLGISPYVEDNQLIDLINKSGFSELALRNVLVANPHCSRNPEVMNALLERTPSVSQLTINDVRSGNQTITTKDILEAQVSNIELQVNKDILMLQRYYTDSASYSIDSLITLYNRNEPHLVVSLAEYYAIQGEFTSLSSILSGVDTEYWSGTEVEYLNEMFDFYSGLQSQIESGQYPFGLTQESRNTIANSRENMVNDHLWLKVYSILESYNENDSNYIEPVYFFGSASKSQAIIGNDIPRMSSFEVFPNPTSDYVRLNWDWFEQGLHASFNVAVMDINGNKIIDLEVSDFQKNNQLIKLDNLVAGSYLIRITDTSGEVIHHEYLSVIH